MQCNISVLINSVYELTGTRLFSAFKTRVTDWAMQSYAATKKQDKPAHCRRVILTFYTTRHKNKLGRCVSSSSSVFVG